MTVLCTLLYLSPIAQAQFHDVDAQAAEAFAELIESYRQRPALAVKSTVKVTMREGDIEAHSDDVQAEFVFGSDREAVVKLRGMECYISDGSISVIHEANDEAYFTMNDDGSPYYALLAVFMDLPFPHLGIALGEPSMDDLYMQFHPKAPWLRPTGTALEQRDDAEVRVIRMTSDFESLTMIIDPATNLITSMTLEITGGHLVQQGTTMRFEHAFEYETHDEPLPDQVFTCAVDDRERVDMLVALLPERETRGGGAGATVGAMAPPLVLATMDGGAIDLEELQGQVIVLDFWATWCGPCVQALPLLHEVDRWARDEQLPVKVLTVNAFEIPNPNESTPDARLQQARAFWEQHEFRLPVAMDYTDEVAAEFGVGGIPTTFIIRSDGVVHEQHVGAGATYADDLRQSIRSAIEAVE